MKMSFELYEGWETIDEAIDFFQELCLDLRALKKLNPEPDNPFVHVLIKGEELTDKQLTDVSVKLDFLNG